MLMKLIYFETLLLYYNLMIISESPNSNIFSHINQYLKISSNN